LVSNTTVQGDRVLSGGNQGKIWHKGFPVIKEGDEKNGRSAYIEQFCKEEKEKHRVVTPGVSVICKM